MGRRAKSDTLYWLVKKLSNWHLERLKLLNDWYVKDSKQWKLVAYYADLTTWSRQGELDDWEGTRLDVLKSRTLRWIIRGMSVIGTEPTTELSNAVTDIRRTIAMDAHAAAFEFIDDAKILARELEQFEQLLEILRQELYLLHIDEEAEDKVQIGEMVLAEIAETLAKIEDLNRFHRIRVEHLLPYQEAYAKKTNINEAHSKAFLQTISGIEPGSCLSTRASYEYHFLGYAAKVLTGDLRGGLESVNAALSLHEAHPWLRENRLHQYFDDLNRACGLAGELYIKSEAAKRIAQLRQAYEGDAEQRLTCLGPFVKALLFTAYRFQDESYGSMAIEIFEANRQALSRTLSNGQLLQVMYRAACWQLALQHYQVALYYFEELWALRSHDAKGHFVHCRVMEAICLIGLGADDERIQRAATNAAKYINRQEEPHEIPLMVCRHLERLPSLTLGDNVIIAHLEQCLVKVRRLAEKNAKMELITGLSYMEILDKLIASFKTHHR